MNARTGMNSQQKGEPSATAVLPGRRRTVPNGASGSVSSKSFLYRGLERPGYLISFMFQVHREVPTAWRLYRSEIFRHAGVLVRSNAAVVLFVSFMLGLLLGLTVHYLFTPIGAESYVAVAQSIGAFRGILEVAFAWMFAAKVGCGIVAELGSMRINDEIDAMEVMGIRSISYLASTRYIAALITTPFMYLASCATLFVGGYLINTKLLNTASEGAFHYYLFLFQNTLDFGYALLWATLLILVITLVACYYGYTAKGGPVGVGTNTAQSMLVNMVLVSVIAMMLVQLLYGNSPNAPIAN